MRRAWVLCVLAVGCGSASAPPSATLLVDASFATPSSEPSGLSIATAALHLVSVAAVSDRSSADPRATVATLDVQMAGDAQSTISGVPVGLYSGAVFVFGDEDAPGADVEGTFAMQHLHVTLFAPSIYVTCADPIAIDPGSSGTLAIHADPTHWFDGVDLTGLMEDSDDNGLVISEDDNPAVADQILANVAATFSLDCSR